jgi:hypothetical protein
VVVWAVLGVCGCGYAPEIEDVLDQRLKYRDMNLTESALASRIQEIDENYAEPRSPTKVQHSYELSLDSISSVNGYAALWRGTRACAWLALNDPDAGRRKKFAREGVRFGHEAIRKTSTEVESFYYYALCLAGLAKETSTPSVGLIRKLRERMEVALALDPSFDHCGPHRFLGNLMVETADYPLYAVGSLDEGLQHLEKATVLCPDFGGNHLDYAKALMGDEQLEEARSELEGVLTCPEPPDYAAEHQEWLSEAGELLTDLKAGELEE